jgi:protein-S-isoprenylcysteine O-methyltransferase Ste14
MNKTPSTRTIVWTLVAIQGLLLLGVFVGPNTPALRAPEALRVAGQFIQAIGVALIVISAIELGRRLTAHPTPNGRGSLRRSGLYRFVRHPMYTGVMAMAIGSSLTNSSVVRGASTGMLVLLFAIKARFEELSLVAHFTEYSSYASTTGRFLPVPHFSGDGIVSEHVTSDQRKSGAILPSRFDRIVVARPSMQFGPRSA